VSEPRRDRRAERHTATRQEILDAAWRLGRERGLGGWSLRDVADAVGMRPPSLYVYFASKFALYDAMFAEGCRDLLSRSREARAELAASGGTPVEAVHRAATVFMDFCVEDPARMHLLFLRTIPGFEPSEHSYALAQEILAVLTAVLDEAGVGRPEQVDLWTALVTGLVTQQISNEPGGDRWLRLLEPAMTMFVALARQPG
jgi:AcrR family transcriptional regulator